MAAERIAQRVALLLEDARWAQADGDPGEVEALANAVLALDPGNAEAEALLAGSARRLQMTLMFCDLVGSTQLADRLDPEDLTEILRGYRTACAEAVERYGGFIEDRQGDGLLVRFGYPRVHEDDARRAVLAGLEMVRLVGELALEVRIAVHTGVVVVDAGDVVGAAPNEVARLQATADPGVVLISDETHELAGGYFEVEPRGPVELRGVSRPIMTYDVRRERASARLEAASSLTPFIGRRDECAAIAELWGEAVAGGSPSALLVSGGAGIGKSRLLMEAASTVEAPCRVCQCSGYHQTTSLHAFRRVLESACGIEEGDGPETRLARLRALAGEEDLPLLAAALSIPAEQTAPPPEVDPSMLRVRALHVAAGIVAATPSLLLVEDLHWADESTLDLLGVLLSVPRPGLLTVLTARDDFEPPWPVRRVPLGPLPAGELEAMAREIPESARLPEYELQDLVSRSDGVPLFLEELARGASAGPRELPEGMRRPDPRLPAALRDPLLARLASSGVDLDLVQIASTIGRDVDRELLQRVAGLSDETFGAKLANLLASGLLDRTGDADRPLPARADPRRGLRDPAARGLPGAPQPDRRPAARRGRAGLRRRRGRLPPRAGRALPGGDRRPHRRRPGRPGAGRPQGGHAGAHARADAGRAAAGRPGAAGQRVHRAPAALVQRRDVRRLLVARVARGPRALRASCARRSGSARS